MIRPLACAKAVEWRAYAEYLEQKDREHRLTSYRLTRIEEALGITTGKAPAAKGVVLEVRFPAEPDRTKPHAHRGGSYIGVRNMSDDHDICFKFASRIPPGMESDRLRPGGITHLVLPAGSKEWMPITGAEMCGATIWAIRP